MRRRAKQDFGGAPASTVESDLEKIALQTNNKQTALPSRINVKVGRWSDKVSEAAHDANHVQPLTQTMEVIPMAQASNSLSHDTFRPISASAVHVLARLAAKRAVQEELRSQGVRISLVKPAEIAQQANAYLALHPELYDEARERAQRLGMFAKPKRRRRS
jgi:hypothetical protein